MNSSPAVNHISECFIKPLYTTEELKKPCYLSPWDIAMSSIHYIQKGLLFNKSSAPDHNQEEFVKTFLDKLKHSLSLALVHFYPLSGRLVTRKSEDPHSYIFFIDCNNSPGAKFIYATLDMKVFDILSPVDVPVIVKSFFDLDRLANHDGHTNSLLSIQVTELIDGIFIGCSMNHCVVDGTSYSHFLNAWSEIFQLQAQGQEQEISVSISRPPIHNRWFPDGYGRILNLPFKHHDEFISRYESPELRERIFHFSAESIAKLKANANAEFNTNKISSFQSLLALVWKAITRARHLPHDQMTNCKLAINNRSRLNPPLPRDYFGNSINVVMAIAPAGELLENSLGWAAWKLHLAVKNHTDKMVREGLQAWLQTPTIYQFAQLADPYGMIVGSSPRFNMYGNEFGMGKAVAIRSGYANKLDGNLMAYPGYEGGGSIDLEICLSPDTMRAIESDEEFMNAVSMSNPLF
ncbi:HXXXD-type acyl-transferase family protein [Quillaja saponaria]|uniref:HXXXD-type acyl-transferase family protein n=1 Tax=Quillaja saponaria TaxID=32244 RepID=A0AAD7PGT8_QUISA|nr:HXXXD-type acyl-transferase family protein [Quillaja saponaria]